MSRQTLSDTAKSAIKNGLLKCGIVVSRSQPLNIVSRIAGRGDVRIGQSIIDDILAFYGAVPPFYGDDVAGPLKIAGAWRGDLLRRRSQQLAAVELRDSVAYRDLLEQLFRSELISGMWNHGYYGESDLVPPAVLKDIMHFEIETGRSPTDLVRKAKFSSEWGVPFAGDLVKFVDPYHGRQAHRISVAHRHLYAMGMKGEPDGRPDFMVDLGSGFGGTASYLIEWADEPFNLMLVDIPLNLTTAYAYLASQYPGIDIKLASSADEVASFAVPRRDRTALLLVPTTLLEQALSAVRPILLHNSASFSEMDLETVRFYLDMFAKAGAQGIVETNSGQRESINADGHREVNSWDIEAMLSDRYALVSRTKVEDVRYVTSIYTRRAAL